MPRKPQCPDCKTKLEAISITYDKDSRYAGSLAHRGYCGKCEKQVTDNGMGR